MWVGVGVAVVVGEGIGVGVVVGVGVGVAVAVGVVVSVVVAVGVALGVGVSVVAAVGVAVGVEAGFEVGAELGVGRPVASTTATVGGADWHATCASARRVRARSAGVRKGVASPVEEWWECTRGMMGFPIRGSWWTCRTTARHGCHSCVSGNLAAVGAPRCDRQSAYGCSGVLLGDSELWSSQPSRMQNQQRSMLMRSRQDVVQRRLASA